MQSCESSCDGEQGQANILSRRCLGSDEQARPVCACGEEVKVSVLGLALFGTALYERVQMHYRF